MVSKREDGYHNIDTCFYPVPWTDVLEILPSQTNSFASTGIPITGKAEDNLCLKAYYLLADEFALPPVSIHLHKVVPIGAGLGGGSSDAAFTLKVLNDLFQLGLNDQQLANCASRIGSDCSFFIDEAPMIGSGRGEVLASTGLSLKGKFLIVVKPDIHVSTADAYKGVTPREPASNVRTIVENYQIEEWPGLLVNDFEYNVFRQYPVIGKIKDEMYKQGAVYSSMSGSGSSVFGVFHEATDLSSHFRGMTYWSGVL